MQGLETKIDWRLPQELDRTTRRLAQRRPICLSHPQRSCLLRAPKHRKPRRIHWLVPSPPSLSLFLVLRLLNSSLESPSQSAKNSPPSVSVSENSPKPANSAFTSPPSPSSPNTPVTRSGSNPTAKCPFCMVAISSKPTLVVGAMTVPSIRAWWCIV